MIEKLKALLCPIREALAAGAALVVAVMAFMLRRKTRQLETAKMELVECHEDQENEKQKETIASLEAEVIADEKDRQSKRARLDALLSRDERKRRGD